MRNNSPNTMLLAVGIPTFKRPEFAIRLINKLLDIGIYDQIIVSSNSEENTLIEHINKINDERIIFYQQKQNVGLALNYFKLIELCKCEYLHVISDEDLPIESNLIDLYDLLRKSKSTSLVVTSVNDKNGKLYKDASWQKNTFLKNLLGETAHIGSNIINISMINKYEKDLLLNYCQNEGSVYVGPAAVFLAYSVGQNLIYFGPPIVQMGPLHENREITGSFIYGFKARIFQYVNLCKLYTQVSFKKKYMIGISILYYFSHHALQDAVKKYSDSPKHELKRYLNENNVDLKTYISLFALFVSFYYFKLYFYIRIKISKIVKNLILKTRP